MRTIAECKKIRVLPKEGTWVVTKPSWSFATSVARQEFRGMRGLPLMTAVAMPALCDLVKIGHLEARKAGTGIYRGFAAGCGGDVWWIEHSDGSIGAYLADEVFDPPGTKKRFRTHRKDQP